MFTYEEAYRRYTNEFTHTEEEEQADGNIMQVTYRPESLCNHKDLDAIFSEAKDWDEVLVKMRDFVGSSVRAK